MGRREDKAQPWFPAGTGRAAGTSLLPPVPQPRGSRPMQPLSGPWPSPQGRRRQQPVPSLPRRAARCQRPAPPPAPEPPPPPLRFSLRLTPEAALLIQKKRSPPQQQLQRLPPGASPQRFPPAAPDLGSLLKVSLLNAQHRYDGEEYEEEAPPGRDLLRKCTEWLRGVESATRGPAGDRLRALPHLNTL
ncbi:proline-rich protein 18 [Rhinatrema bivittatum]|uniref:proline-rich protein 18 n=1 Tax=Rhinatrema bivittatum TaxID=194408 RepID=UPI001128AD95|nr:proline-rich protein 18 [Rhinatrema bivittatum]